MRSNRVKRSVPVIIAGADPGRRSAISIGRVLDRVGGRVRALVDAGLERNQPITIFLTDSVYLGEVVDCVAQGRKYTIELLLIQYKS